MEAKYGSGKYCPQGPESCRDETKLKAVLESSRNYDELLDAWTGWHSTAKPMRADYARYVELANEGARGFGFEDLGAMWRSNYDMSAAEFQREAARLYGQVQPLYKELHCYTRNKLQRSTARTRCRRASRSRRTCSATCGRSSGTRSTSCSSRTRG